MSLLTVVLILFLILLSMGQEAIKSREALELIEELEVAFCRGKPQHLPCNEALGKVCLKGGCVSVCAPERLAECKCRTNSCGVCCGECSPAEELGILHYQELPWFRQNQVENCVRPTPYGPICPLTQDGKICDLVLQPGKDIEQPMLCRNGECQRPKCAMFQNAQILDCGCRDRYADYPFCCRLALNESCLPLQWWLRQFASVFLHEDAFTNSIQGSCLAKNSDGVRCGSRHVCRDYQCEHVCGGFGETECICPQNSNEECHVCCLESGVCRGSKTNLFRSYGQACNFSFGSCNSVGICAPVKSHPISEEPCQKAFGSQSTECICSGREECLRCCSDGNQCSPLVEQFRPSGTPCNFSLGTCSPDGKCQNTANSPILEFCQRTENEGKSCGFGRECLKGACQHVCGSEERVCVCPPGSAAECRLCCLNEAGQCLPGWKNYFLPMGTPCNFTYGTCTAGGNCLRLPQHPAMHQCDYTENEGNQCAARHVCREFQCRHICRREDLECKCGEGSADECKVCCFNGGVCRSTYDPRWPFLIQSIGTACNFTRGTCNAAGVCEAKATFCKRPDHEGMRCGPMEVCGGGECRHVCGNSSQECFCDPNSSFECHVCCLAENEFGNGTVCRSAYSPKRSYLVRPVGTACNFTRGVCLKGGICDDVLNHPFYGDRSDKVTSYVALLLAAVFLLSY